MDSQLKGNFIMISPHEKIAEPIAIFNIVGIGEEYTTEYYPIMSNFYDTASWFGVSNTLNDISGDPLPSQVLQYNMVNKINYNGTIYWLSVVNNDSLIYRTIGNSAYYITISTTDDWDTYTVTYQQPLG